MPPPKLKGATLRRLLPWVRGQPLTRLLALLTVPEQLPRLMAGKAMQELENRVVQLERRAFWHRLMLVVLTAVMLNQLARLTMPALAQEHRFLLPLAVGLLIAAPHFLAMGLVALSNQVRKLQG